MHIEIVNNLILFSIIVYLKATIIKEEAVIHFENLQKDFVFRQHNEEFLNELTGYGETAKLLYLVDVG